MREFTITFTSKPFILQGAARYTGAASRIIKTLPKRKKGKMDPRIEVISNVNCFNSKIQSSKLFWFGLVGLVC